MQLFINDSGKPIIPKCGNCAHWMKVNPKEKKNATGYCKLMKLYFAYTRKNNVYGMTKDFYYCDSHELENADLLTQKGNVQQFDSLEDATALIKDKI